MTTLNVRNSEGQEDLVPIDGSFASHDPLCPPFAAPEAAAANAPQRNGTILCRRRGCQGSGRQVRHAVRCPKMDNITYYDVCVEGAFIRISALRHRKTQGSVISLVDSTRGATIAHESSFYRGHGKTQNKPRTTYGCNIHYVEELQPR